MIERYRGRDLKKERCRGRGRGREMQRYKDREVEI